eukprot:692037-Lingulodinium_polyedra.AAC.1
MGACAPLRRVQDGGPEDVHSLPHRRLRARPRLPCLAAGHRAPPSPVGDADGRRAACSAAVAAVHSPASPQE